MAVTCQCGNQSDRKCSRCGRLVCASHASAPPQVVCSWCSEASWSPFTRWHAEHKRVYQEMMRRGPVLVEDACRVGTPAKVIVRQSLKRDRDCGPATCFLREVVSDDDGVRSTYYARLADGTLVSSRQGPATLRVTGTIKMLSVKPDTIAAPVVHELLARHLARETANLVVPEARQEMNTFTGAQLGLRK